MLLLSLLLLLLLLLLPLLLLLLLALVLVAQQQLLHVLPLQFAALLLLLMVARQIRQQVLLLLLHQLSHVETAGWQLSGRHCMAHSRGLELLLAHIGSGPQVRLSARRCGTRWQLAVQSAIRQDQLRPPPASLTRCVAQGMAAQRSLHGL